MARFEPIASHEGEVRVEEPLIEALRPRQEPQPDCSRPGLCSLHSATCAARTYLTVIFELRALYTYIGSDVCDMCLRRSRHEPLEVSFTDEVYFIVFVEEL